MPLRVEKHHSRSATCRPNWEPHPNQAQAQEINGPQGGSVMCAREFIGLFAINAIIGPKTLVVAMNAVSHMATPSASRHAGQKEEIPEARLH
jgi:hypothetical protein